MKDHAVQLIPPLRLMSALPAPALPDLERAGRYAFEPKMDGFRCVAFRTDSKYQATSPHSPATKFQLAQRGFKVAGRESAPVV